MSATADITRYKEYFRDVGRGERVEVIAIPSSPRTSIFQRKVLYLEQVNIVFFFCLSSSCIIKLAMNRFKCCVLKSTQKVICFNYNQCIGSDKVTNELILCPAHAL